MNTKERLEDRLYKLESKLYNSRKCKNESLPFTTEDCKSLKQIIGNDLPECEIDITDDNADYGYLNIGIYNPNYITDYDIVQEDVNSFKVINNDNELGEADSLDSAASILCDHFIKNYVNDNIESKILESRLAKLERILLGKGDSLTNDISTFTSNIVHVSDIMRDTAELWYEGLVLSPDNAKNVKADLIDIITKSKNILRGLM